MHFISFSRTTNALSFKLNTMRSPITGKEMKLVKEPRTMTYRSEPFEILFHSYNCEDSMEQFTNTELDELNLRQLYNQYRAKYSIPFPDEIIKIREMYHLPASKMADILGFGINSYRNYEAGEMPSIANSKLIRMAADPKKFIEMINLCGTMDQALKSKYIHKAQLLIHEDNPTILISNFEAYLLGSSFANIYSGYRKPNLEKFAEMVVYFAEQLKPYKTKLNKLLFYADFLMFKQSCFSISGMQYRAIEMGPVPINFQSIFEYLDNKNVIDVISNEISNGKTAEQFIARKDRPFNSTLFSKEELAVVQHVANVFDQDSTTKIIEISHREKAWTMNEKERKLISYRFAFDLNPIETPTQSIN